LGLDLQKVSRQDSSRNTHALEHGSSQKRVGLPRAGGQAALGAHPPVDICQDEPSDISCVGSRRSSHPSSYMPCRIRKLKPLPLSRCLPRTRGICWRMVLRSCRMGIRFSEVDSTGEMTMLEFLQKKIFLCESAFRISCCSLSAESDRAFC